MPAGLPYFAWIDASETVFGSEHLRWDEAVFSFTLKQDEGDPASLTAVVRRPRNDAGGAIGLLGPGRKIWAWFALDCGPALFKFRGRLVGIPTSIFEELVTLEFVARPVDVVAQKEALAATLRVLPYYDEAVIDEERRKDPDVVLEGYTKIWAYDRETLVVSVSDEVAGEDGLVEFDGDSDGGKVLYDGLGLTLTSGPLSRVDVNAEYTWTQQARGTVDLTQYITQAWLAQSSYQAITLKQGDWPKNGSSLGDGWEVASSTAIELYPPVSYSETSGSVNNVKYAGIDAHTTSFTETLTGSSPGGLLVPGVGGPSTRTEDIKVSYSEDGDGHQYQSGYSRNYSESGTPIYLQAIQVTLVAGYTAARPCRERVSFSLVADVQPILTDPEDGEVLRIDDVKSINLSESIGGAAIVMDDPRRRSYIATERGNRSVEHLIALARAHLMKRARAVEITFVPKLSRMPEITLRKNAFLVEPRVGEALGKITSYSIALDGSDGRINCEVRIGCTIGRGGSAVATAGEPTYGTTDYMGADYQQFTGRIVLLDSIDSSVGYEPPQAAPNDDGLNFLAGLSANDVIEVPLSLLFGPDANQLEQPEQPGWEGVVAEDNADEVADYYRKQLEYYQVSGRFKLKSMSRNFSTDYVVQVTDVKIPTGIDLEAT